MGGKQIEDLEIGQIAFCINEIKVIKIVMICTLLFIEVSHLMRKM